MSSDNYASLKERMNALTKKVNAHNDIVKSAKYVISDVQRISALVDHNKNRIDAMSKIVQEQQELIKDLMEEVFTE